MREPSITLDGDVAKANDWIPFARTVLKQAVQRGFTRRTLNPEKGVYVYVSNVGDIPSIHINAQYPRGPKFVGIPWDSLNVGGWGAPYGDPDNIHGTAGSDKQSQVILEQNRLDVPWEAYRFPDYAVDYPIGEDGELQYGNLDWTSADGEIVLTWKGMNSTHYGKIDNWARIVEGDMCCSATDTVVYPDVEEANNWRVGSYFQGYKVSDGDECLIDGGYNHTPELATDIFAVKRHKYNAATNTFQYAFEYGVDNNIYRDGEVFFAVPEDITAIMGAAIQTVPDGEGGVTEYLVVIGGTYTPQYGIVKEELIRAPLDDLSNYTKQDIQIYGLLYEESDINLNSWCFNSQGNEALVVRDLGPDINDNGYSISSDYGDRAVLKLSISDEGFANVTEAWRERNHGGPKGVQTDNVNANQATALEWDTEANFNGVVICAAGYQDDVPVYAKLWAEESRTFHCERDAVSGGSHAFENVVWRRKWHLYFSESITAEAQVPSSALVIWNSEHEASETVSTTTEHYRYISSEVLRHPGFIDCRHKLAVLECREIPQNTLVINLHAVPVSYNEEDPWNMKTSHMVWVDGKIVHESEGREWPRRSKECNNMYSNIYLTEYYNTGAAIYTDAQTDLDAMQLSDFNFNDVFPPYPTQYKNRRCLFNVQTHPGYKDGDFTVFVTVRDKNLKGGEATSFVAYYNESLEELTDLVTIEEIAEIGEHYPYDSNVDKGIMSHTGKL